jgi:hypothetical protein
MIRTARIKPLEFAIDRDNSIRLLGPDDKPFTTETTFSSLDELVGVSQGRNWSKTDVTEVWNKYAAATGRKPQKAFKNRLFGLQRIWDGIQPSNVVEVFEKGRRIAQEYQDTPAVAQAEAEVLENTPMKAKTKKPRPPKAPKPPKEPRKTAAKAEKKPATKTREPRANTKRQEVIRLIQRDNGATQAEIMEKMGWQRHTVRGFMSTLGSKYGIKVTSTKSETKGLVYTAA